MERTTTQRTPPQATNGSAQIHPFTQLVLKFTFNKPQWDDFEKKYKANPSKVPSEYKITKDQADALGSRDPIGINDQIVKEYYDAATPKNMDDLVGGIPVLIKDWPTHQQ